MQDFPSISLAACAERRAGPEEIRKLRDAFLRHGFFLLSEHDVDQTLIDAAIDASADFFDLPAELKSAYGHAAQSVFPQSCRGYVPLYGETLHDEAGPDPKEIFDLGIDRPPTGEPFVGRNVLPDDETAPRFASSLLALQERIMNAVVPPLTRAMARDHAADGIRVNAVGPGPILTRFHEQRAADAGRQLDEFSKEFGQETMLNRPGTPREVAHAILFLASDDASFITGTLLFVDGGKTAM